MADILHDFTIAASPEPIFEAISTPQGLDAWWTLHCEIRGADYALDFGPGYHWRAQVAHCRAPLHIGWTFMVADEDWTGTDLSFALEPTEQGTAVRFAHTGWLEANAHYRISSYCWAMYLRLLKRF